MLQDQVTVEDLAHALEKLVEQHDMRKFHFDVKSLNQESHLLEVEHIWEVIPHRHLQLEHIFRHYHVPILTLHGVRLLNDGS